MNKQLWIFAFGLFLSSAAYAQDYGLTIGVHQTSASVDAGDSTTLLNGKTGSANGSLGYDLGLTASFELMPDFRFRTGILYDYRPFDYKLDSGGTAHFRFGWIDIPVNVQYNFTQMVGIYGGLIVGVKASDSVDVPTSLTSKSPGAKALYPLLNGGVNFMFNDMIGLDVYYEYGMGSFADNAKNYSTVGMHFIYWL